MLPRFALEIVSFRPISRIKVHEALTGVNKNRALKYTVVLK